jgi:hypothetical protein
MSFRMGDFLAAAAAFGKKAETPKASGNAEPPVLPRKRGRAGTASPCACRSRGRGAASRSE